MFTFHFQLTEDDIFEYRLCSNYTTPAYRKKIMMHRYLNPVFFIIWVIFLGFLLGHSLLVYACAAVISIGWIAFDRKLVERNIRRSVKRLSETGKARYPEETQAIFDEEKFVTITKHVEITSGYSAIAKIVVGGNAVYLYRNAITILIMPYRIFAGGEEKEAFVQFIQQKTNAAVVSGVTK